jgi:DNA polymerase I-like protein with 3'-5' exonuclease and polymerase domains/5'-3' exonuclease
MYVAVDVSSILWTALKAGKDREGALDENGNHCNSAGYGYENAINSVVRALQELNAVPSQLILVEEGYNSKSPRLNIDPNYKATRGKKSKLEYENFNKLKTMFLSALKGVGALVVRQDNAEGDDVLGWLAKHTEREMVIMTNDGDLTVLNGGLVTVRVNGVMGANKYGDWPHKYVTLYKAMVGDSSDNISGIRGFGQKAWEQVVARFGVAGMDVLVKCALDGSVASLREDSEKDAFVKKIYDGGADFIRSYKLARVYPEWVDTVRDALVFEPGMVVESSDERLRRWSAVRKLITADKWAEFVPWALKHLAQSRGWFALDIETSSADQSDAWLAAQDDPDGVDTIGSTLSGLSLTFGANHHLTVYIPVDHINTSCVSADALGDFLTDVFATGIRPVIHNTMFECSLLHKLYGERWRSNGYRGFLPNFIDTLFEASYVDENGKLGLKHLSKRWLGYEQTDYDSTVAVCGVKYKMNQLSAQHVFDYACDDTVTTAALHNFFSTFLMLEHTADILEKVEYPAAYLHIQSFVTGCNVDLAKLEELKREDSAVRDAAQTALDKYLIEKGWDGTVPPQLTTAPTAADIKLIHKIVTGEELETAVRTPAKLLAMIMDRGLVGALEAALAGELEPVNALINKHYVCKPTLNVGSPKQMQKLFYETMGLPIQVYNAPTENMRAKGLKEGSPKTDNLAVTYGLLVAEPEVAEALKAVRELRMVNTRFGLYYDTLPNFVHWKTGRVHSSHRQCSTNTRRASSARPNLQQLSKNEKVEGFSPRVRELYVPHKADAAIVSLDFSSQELLLMAEWSHDPRMESCFVGDTLTDMHSATGVGIYNRIHGAELSYEEYVALVKASDKEAKRARALAKAVNFGSQYRIAAKKLSTILLVTEQEAQAMLDAKAEAFPRAEEWSQEAMDAAKASGVVKTMLGAKRHLLGLINSPDKFIASKAPRQALSYLIQGSAAEQTKLAEGRSLVLLDRFDCEFISSIHDECVWSVAVSDLPKFIPEAHALMTENYANMRLPIRSSVSVGWNFGEQKELDGDFSEANIRKALGI